MKKNNTKTFIEDARKIHGDEYDYSLVEYNGIDKKVRIICPIHGEFLQTPYVHNNLKCGCPKCGHEKTNNKKKMNLEEFIEKARKVHGNKYDYSKVNYVNYRTKVCIICPQHGEFWQRPDVHIRGNGCHECSIEKKKKIFSDGIENFIEKARKVYGDKYDYSKVIYTNAKEKVCIICPIHGEFWQEPYTHLVSKYGCPKCGKNAATLSETMSSEDFIEKARQIHGDKYDYSKVDYKKAKSAIRIICKKHGEFLQTPDAHLHGCGCQRCSNTKSKGEEEILEFIKNSFHGEVKTRDRTIIPPYELDIYIPNLKIAIEYNGLRWHSEQFNKDRNYHLKKLEMCNQNDIKLISIFEDEWIERKDIVKSKILHLINAISCKDKIYARKCTISIVDKKIAADFFEKYHIQGKCNTTLNYGCYYANILVGVMAFKKINNKNEWELVRFATNNDYICSGIGGKLFKTFIKEKQPSLVKSFADRRWTLSKDNNLYTKIGFQLSEILKPNYRYIVNNKRIHKFNFRKKILNKKYNLPLKMSEKEMTEEIGIYRIWDCGLFKYVWTKE